MTASIDSGDRDTDEDGFIDSEDDCDNVPGTSVYDRKGCIDTDSDGYSNPETGWSTNNGADAFANEPTQWQDTDNDGYPNDCDQDCLDLGMSGDLDDDGDEVLDADDAFPLDSNESVDSDGDSIGNNADADDDNDGVTDEQELIDGTNPLDARSCSGCYSVFDVDADGEVKPLTDGLLLIRYFFGLTGDALVRGAVNGDGNRTSAEAIESYLESHML